MYIYALYFHLSVDFNYQATAPHLLQVSLSAATALASVGRGTACSSEPPKSMGKVEYFPSSNAKATLETEMKMAMKAELEHSVELTDKSEGSNASGVVKEHEQREESAILFREDSDSLGVHGDVQREGEGTDAGAVQRNPDLHPGTRVTSRGFMSVPTTLSFAFD